MIAFVFLALFIGRTLADTIIKDDPARFDGIATDGDGNYVPVTGEVDTIQVFDTHLPGREFNDTGLAINVSVSGLNQTNTPHTVRYVTIPPSKTLPAPPPHFWNLNIPLQNATSSNGTNITGLSYAPANLFSFWAPPPPQQQQQQQQFQNTAANSTFAQFQYPNFGAKYAINKDEGRVGGPHASEAFSKLDSGFVDKDGDYNSLDAMGEKGNSTLSSILGTLVNMITAKQNDNTHILAQYVDEYPTYDYNADTQPSSTKDDDDGGDDDSVIDINPQIYADIWNPAKWNSFTNISFDKEQPSSSIAKSSSNLWNEALWAKLAAIQQNVTRNLATNFGMPQWTLNYSSPEVQQLMQNAFLLNLTSILNGLNSNSSFLPSQLSQQMSASLRIFLKALSPSNAYNLFTNSSTTIPAANLPFYNAFLPYMPTTTSTLSSSPSPNEMPTTRSPIKNTRLSTTPISQFDLTQLLSSIDATLQKLNKNMAPSSYNDDSEQVLSKSITVRDTKSTFSLPKEDEIVVDPDLDVVDDFDNNGPSISLALQQSRAAPTQLAFSQSTLVLGMIGGVLSHLLFV